MKQYVTYLRVSTKKQGSDGLGIDAQRASVSRFVGSTGAIIKEFVEVESGGKDERPQLLAAIEEARVAKATLLIAKLDRLSRNASFIFKLRDAQIDFQCCDMPDATPVTVGIMAVLAENERSLISTRTKAALAAKKARGGTLGNKANFTVSGRLKGQESHRNNAKTAEANVKAANLIALYHEKLWSIRQIAAELNKLGYKTRRGCVFTSCAVFRLLPAKEPLVA
ncbi:MAG: recombinase family protein [Hymenobacter sp.]|nr:MAG: recombinase family protein [Hymenobacter sp.]